MPAPSPSKPGIAGAGWYVLVGSGLYLCFNLISLRGAPFLLGGDEQVFWMNALRMLQGELIYRDFFEFTPPGTDLVYLGAFALLGPRIWVPNVVQLLLGVSLACLCFHLARSIMRAAEAALTAALFLVLLFGKWLDATHHWFSLLAVMTAVAVLMRGSSATRVLVCGALLGLASFFTQTRGIGAAFGFAVFLLWDGMHKQLSWRRQCGQLLRLLLALVLTWLILSSYFIYSLGIYKLFYFQALYVLEHVSRAAQRLLYPTDQDPFAWPIHYQLIFFAQPLIYTLSLWRCGRAALKGSVFDARVALLALVGAAMFLEVAQNPNWLRVDCIAMPALILLVWLVSETAERLPAYARLRTPAIALTAIGLIGVSAHQVWTRNIARPLTLDLPAGRSAVTALAGEKLTWLARRTTPGELFFQARYQSLYLPLQLRNPAFDFLDRYTSPELVALDLRQLADQSVRYILWSPLDRPRFPAFEQFLYQRYRRVWRFTDAAEIWELRQPGP
jgi:hypothetical protein